MSVTRNILLIEGDQRLALRVRQALRESSDGPYRIDCEATLGGALARLESVGPGSAAGEPGFAAILVDLFLADSAGIATFDSLLAAARHIPILVLVDPQNETLAQAAVTRGAQDYLLKDRIDDYLLPKTLRNTIERTAIAEALFVAQERAAVTLDSIGDAVLSTDAAALVTYLNAAAERLTGWTRTEAAGIPAASVLSIIDADTRRPVENPLGVAIRENRSISLNPNGLLVHRNGIETAIEDSVAPIHDRNGHVTGAVIVFRDVSAARSLTRRLAHLAQHDSLTDLPNRNLFGDRLNQALAHAQRNRTKLALLYVDLDRFKSVNDSAGHATGDRLLQSAAARLLASVRSSDTVSRQGGDEFVVLLSRVSHAADAAVAAEKMLAALTAPYEIDELELRVSASIGIATYPMDGTTAEALLQNADTAMYRAKERGRNTYQFYTAAMNSRSVDRRQLEADLRRALANDEFALHYQPKVSLLSGAVTGLEALIRWRHPSRRLIRPVSFISIAEESGLIVPIGRWVLREACRQAAAWPATGMAPIGVAVNVSTVELRAKHFVAGVRTILADTGLAAHRLELEVTETFLMQDTASTGSVLQELKQLGVHLALDDFGTGYSSLTYLQKFPIDALKIDHSFVQHVTTDPGDANVVSAVVNMGKSLHLRVVAEGVETAEQYERLQQEHCPEAQGNYFCEPVMPEEIARSFASRKWRMQPEPA
jgi:diguanylate cyclase (GGDEF)-like protein/PAS domain S-box-containing protein